MPFTERTTTPATLSDCDREQIQFIGRVQSFAALMAISEDGFIQRASANIAKFIGLDHDTLIGQNIAEVFPAHTVDALRALAQETMIHAVSTRRLGVDLMGAGDRLDITSYTSGAVCVLELEQAGDEDAGATAEAIVSMLPVLRQCTARQQMFELICDQIASLISYDRIMVYTFADDGCGEVVAERCAEGMAPYKGLRYPATDIPAQARALLLRQTVRINADTDDEGVPIVPALSPEREPLDLSHSVVRLQSRLHQEYLHNMGVAASVTISLICNGVLVGLVACHHRTPKALPLVARAMLELYGYSASCALEAHDSTAHMKTHAVVQQVHNRIAQKIAAVDDIQQSADAVLEELAKVIDFDGHALWINGSYLSDGITLSKTEFMPLMRFLNTASPREVFNTEAIGTIFPAAEAFLDRVCGVIAVPISRNPRDYLVLFRSPVVQHIAWAGKPEKSPGREGRLTPRKSFEAWKESKYGTSVPWNARERALAEAVRGTLLEVILRLSDNALAERERADQMQRLLIAELNHRVRNILTLIKNVVEQSGAAAVTVPEFTQIVGGRLHALAEAHDLITRQNWESASLSELIYIELRGFVSDFDRQVDITGPDVLITPQAATTLALVLHEMVTNAAKYGALSRPHGRVSINIGALDDLGVRLFWRESGGPAVTPPARRGFGSTIVAEAMPYEFGGEAEVRFELSGVSAKFLLPAQYVTAEAGAYKRPVSMAPKRQDKDAPSQVCLPKRLLIVEDLLLLAKGTKMLVERLGVERAIVSASVIDALERLEEADFDCALLDYNLADETSEPVARALKSKGIPFALLTGYDADPAMLREFPGVRVLTKPVTTAQLKEVMSDLVFMSKPSRLRSNPQAVTGANRAAGRGG